jgi:hypothetical protein
MNTLQLAKIKEYLLQEIGDASAKDLPTVGDPTNYKTNYGSEADTYSSRRRYTKNVSFFISKDYCIFDI